MAPNMNLNLGISKRRVGTLPVIDLTSPISPQSLDVADYNPDEGTFVFEWTDASPTSTSNGLFFSLNDGTNSNRFDVQLLTAGSLRPRVTSGGSDQIKLSGANSTYTDLLKHSTQKLTIVYKNGDYLHLYWQGVKTMYRDVALTFPTSVNTFQLGRFNSGGTLTLTETINSFQYYDKALSEAQCRKLSRNNNLGSYSNQGAKAIPILGQSNAIGEGGGSFTYANIEQMFNLDMAGNYETYVDPMADNTDNQYGSLLSYGNAGLSYGGLVIDGLAESLGGNWFTVPCGQSSTSVTGDWDPAIAFEDSVVLTSFLTTASAFRTLQAIQAADDIPFMIWHQGESDAVAATSETDFKDNTVAILDEYRKAIGKSNLPVFLIQLHDWVSGNPATETNWNNIRDWQEELASANGYTLISGDGVTSQSSDEVHVNQFGKVIYGERIIAAAEALLEETETLPAFTTSFGTIPDIKTDYPAWEAWLFNRENQFKSHAPIERTTEYYFSQDGNDSSGDGSLETPWQTIAKANSTITASSGDITLYFRRGDIWEEADTLTVNRDNVTISDYGSGNRPFFNCFAEKIASGSTWTSEGSDVYSITVTDTIGWIRDEADRLGETNGMFALASSNSGGGAGASDYWWYQDTGTDTLYVHLNGVDPDTLDLEYSISNEDSGIRVTNVDGVRINNIRIDGYSYSQTSGNHNSGYAIMTQVANGKAVYVTNCETYFGSPHILGHLVSGSGGGIVMFSNCTYGYADYGGSGGETLLNFYEGSGGGQFYDMNNTCMYGLAPSYEWTYTTNKARGRSVYAHSTGGNTSDLVVSYGHTVKNSIHPAGVLGGFNDVPAAGDDHTASRAFIVKATQEVTNESVLSGIYMGSDITSYGNLIHIAPLARGAGALWTSGLGDQWSFNDMILIDWKGQTNLNMSIYNATGTSTGVHRRRNYHTVLKQYNIGAGANSGDRMGWDYDNNYDSGPTPSGRSVGSQFINSIDSRDKGANQYPIQYLSLDNTADNIKSSAFFGHNFVEADNARSYSNATDAVDLSAAYDFEFESDLKDDGESGILGHDFFGNPRDATPDIGPIEFDQFNPLDVKSTATYFNPSNFDSLGVEGEPPYDANNLRSMVDQNGVFTFLQETSGDQPAYDESFVGDEDGILFNSGKFMSTGRRVITKDTYDIYIVLNQTGLPIAYGETSVLSQWSSAAEGHMIFGFDDQAAFIRLHDGSSEKTGTYSSDVTSTPQVINFRGDGTGNHSISVDGGAFENVITGASAFVPAFESLMLGDDSGDAQPPFRVADIFISDTNLLDAPRSILINYLKDKWGIS